MNDPSQLSNFMPALAGWGLLGLALCSTMEKLVPIIPSGGMFIMLGIYGVPALPILPWAVAITAAGSTAGSLFWYGLGRWFGPDRGDALALRAGSLLRVRSERYWQLKDRYRRHRFWLTLASQTLPAVRVYAAFPAGVLAMPSTGFIIATFMGAAFWNGPFLLSGYLLREYGFDRETAILATPAAIFLAHPLLFLASRLCRLIHKAA
jgi:alkaline phosphatase